MSASLFDAVAMGEVTHDGALRLPMHGHERPFLCVLLSGAYLEKVHGRRVVYRPGTVVFHPPGTEHADQVGGRGAHLFGIRLGRPWLARVEDAGLCRRVVVDTGGGLARAGTRLAIEHEQPDAFSRLAEDVAREVGVEPLRLARSFRKAFGAGLAEHARACHLHAAWRAIVESERPVAGIAAEAGFSDQSHLTRLMKRRLGTTPGVLRRAASASARRGIV